MPMNNKNTWLVVGALIVVIAVGYLFINRQQPGASSNSVAGTNEASQPGEPQSLKDLMMAGRPMKCEFRDDADSTKTTGQVYVDNKNVRVDFVVTEKDKTTDGHMIVNDTTAYTWMEGSKDGFKMSFTAEQKAEAEQQQVDPNKKLDYECDNWSGDAATFTVPADVNFRDLNSLLPSGAQGNASGSVDMKANACAACDQAPESSRAQCRAALGC